MARWLLVLACLAGCVPEGRQASSLADPAREDAATDDLGTRPDSRDGSVPDAAAADSAVPDLGVGSDLGIGTDVDRPDLGVDSDLGIDPDLGVGDGALLDGGPADAGPADGGQICGDGMCNGTETCQDCAVDCGPCQCPVGFVMGSTGCVPDAPEPFASRSEGAICTRWQQDFVNVPGGWTATSTLQCDLGSVSAAALDNAITRVSLYRWLSGLDPITEDTSRRAAQQECAVIQNALGGLDHTPPTSAPCYTAAGAGAAGSSNLAFGGGSLAASVDLYVGDNGVGSLGHRRWTLNPRMAVTAFGYRPPFSCMYAFSQTAPVSVDWVAWPPPGFVPEQAARGVWSFTSSAFAPNASTTVELSIDGQGFAAVATDRPGGGFGWGSVIAWTPPGGLAASWQAGTTVEVRILGTAGGDVAYSVVFVDCAP